MTTAAPTPNLFAPFLGGPTLLVTCTTGRRGSADLMLSDPWVSDECWIAMQDAPHCHAYR